MNAKLRIALVVIAGCLFSSAFALGGDAEIASRDVMNRNELTKLEQSYAELSALKSKGPLKEDERIKYETCLAAIKEENQKREKLFDLLKEGDNLADSPGILEKVRIQYDTFSVKKEPRAYLMYVFPSVATSESTIFKWVRVDLRGNILNKVVRNTARD